MSMATVEATRTTVHCGADSTTCVQVGDAEFTRSSPDNTWVTGPTVACSTVDTDLCNYHGSVQYVSQTSTNAMVGVAQNAEPPMKWQNQHDLALFLMLTGTIYLIALTVLLSAEQKDKKMDKSLQRVSIGLFILAGVFTFVALVVAISMVMS